MIVATLLQPPATAEAEAPEATARILIEVLPNVMTASSNAALMVVLAIRELTGREVEIQPRRLPDGIDLISILHYVSVDAETVRPTAATALRAAIHLLSKFDAENQPSACSLDTA